MESQQAAQISGAKGISSFIGLASLALEGYHSPKPFNHCLKLIYEVFCWTFTEALPKQHLGQEVKEDLLNRCGSDEFRKYI